MSRTRMMLGIATALSLIGSHTFAGTVAELARLNAPAVVAIVSEKFNGSTVQGAGFVIDEHGIIVTNYHVIEGANAIHVHFDSGDIYDVKGIIAVDRLRDIAVVRVAAYGLAKVRLGNSDSVVVGDPVVAMGNPLGLVGTVTQGIVSAIRVREGAGYRLIQTDAAASPGNSGGPLLDAQGRVIGIVTLGIITGQNLNFAVPVNYARALLEGPQLSVASAISDTTEQNLGLNLPSRWKSVLGGPTWIVRHDGNHLYLEADFGPRLTAMGARKSGALQRIGSSWVGRVVGSHPCVLKDFLAAQTSTKLCDMDEAVDITEITDTRISGFFETFGEDDPDYDCARCKVRGPKHYVDFVWIPE